MSLLDLLFSNLINEGSLAVIDSSGTRRQYGDGSAPVAVARILDAKTERRIVLAPDYHLLESYTDGTLVMEEGSFHDFLDVCCANVAGGGFNPAHKIYQAMGRAFLFWQRWNPVHLAHKRVSHHYDLHENLFRLFLDDDLQYSCAYFHSPEDSLEQAQVAKKRHIIAKLDIKDGQSVLDIGCGWGGMALSIARAADVTVLGVTLSKEQLEVARRRAEQAGLADRVRFELLDYRKLKDKFDRIVSVGMFEHVGPPHYRQYFRKVRDLLTEDGVALVHSVGEFDYGSSNPWIQRHIFPGSYTPSLGQVLPAVEKARLWTTDVEVLRVHYAETLKAWRDRFTEHRAEAAALYDERFCRMWEAYLSACEIGFRRMSLMVFQIQLTKHRYALPFTRDYMFEREKDHQSD
ncbi:cyclopropane fatty acyl phospholipid synthase (unsaturated-phospholipid methyltransferase) [Magnetospirillum gryphiswaldense MSR-1 v2]|uniref:Cyclopropane fatty acyl phospholipid synthase (Unsaturated-phospholipid methyltransferase) n=1 Tax=Magnetospirillum gryphiswaldense (strain DSM 6361 / JCM 21280 / NBRC 15271 / MSR-1) TaxID=431944 RepID=V6F329_MAGGM|nr:cyclopropane-fatty-acyl-phospholipid synthase family protein [Magnetospirillum gryphiswaldense]CDK98706.1 cyclopropane fatty acyl phospholipid synthase (unsaturated-phospholipid methyltransferase) [Magnetospirillum gryphiswaldense MSR-1 v2]